MSFSQMDLEFHNRGRIKDNEQNVNARKTYILEILVRAWIFFIKVLFAKILV